MDDRLSATAVEEARQLLRRFRAEHPRWTDDRTPIDALVAWYGLAVETFSPDDYAEGTFGFLEDGEELIWLNRGLTETLRRFTLAHELGHAALHHGSPHSPQAPGQEPFFADSDAHCSEPDVREEVTGLFEQEQIQELLGIGVAYNPRGERELMANIFAAELLMPLERVRDLYFDRAVAASDLAALFGVSQAAMLNRLVGLALEPHGTDAQLAGPTPEPSFEPAPVQPACKTYDQYQQAALEAPTPALIVAGPGSGKTSTLIGRVDYLVHTLDVAPRHILALTFSRKAAEEMQERLTAVLGVLDANAAERVDMPTVSTFHAFCAELLRTYGGLVGLRPDFSLVDEAEGYFLLRRLAHHLPLQHYRNLPSPAFYFPSILQAISRAKDELVTPEHYRFFAQEMLQVAKDDDARVRAEKALEVAAIYALYEDALRERQDTDFGGLIMLAVQLLQTSPEVAREQQQRYRHILVDEFQDMNRASGILLRLIAGDDRRVWVVGDANQAIYGFRGASPANISRFEEDYPGAVVLPLNRNYRSRPDIVRLAESFRYQQLELGAEVDADTNDSQKEKAEPVRLTQENAYVTLAVAPDAASELTGLVADIRECHEQGYAFRDIVVLCRTRSLVRKVTAALVEAGLPVVEGGGMLEQAHSKDLLSIVMLLAQSDGMGLLRAARLREHPLSQEDVEALLLAAQEQQAQKEPPGKLIFDGNAPFTVSPAGRKSLSRLSRLLQSLSNHASSIWSLLALYLFVETDIARNLLQAMAHNDGQMPALLSDYLAMLQLARRYDQQQQLLRQQEQERQNAVGADSSLPPTPPSIHEQARGFLDYLRVMMLLGQDGGDRQQSAEGDEEAVPDVVRVMTVHASKGLEFPIVYLPNLLQSRFPLNKRSNAAPAPERMLSAESEGDAAHESGEACLFYVGVTRARDHLILSYSERYGKRKLKPSAYLKPLIAGLSEERITRVQWSSTGDSAAIEQDEDDIMPLSQPSERFIEAMQGATLRASAVEEYQQCPRKYMYSSIYHFRGEEAAYMLFWQVTNETMETLKQRLAGTQKGAQGTEGTEQTEQTELPSEEELRDLYTRHWRDREGHTYPFAPIYERHGHEVMKLLRDKMLASGNTNWELRRSFTVEVAGTAIQVSVDRVEDAPQLEQSGHGGKNGQNGQNGQNGKPAKFIRTRFGKSNEKAAGTRELLYARAYREQHNTHNLELHCHNLSTGETFPIKLTTKKEQSLYDALEQSIKDLMAHQYPARYDAFSCPSCPFFLICPA